jgi:hypothetical protein
MDETKGYKRNRYEVADDLRDEISARCQAYSEEFGYSEDLATA